MKILVVCSTTAGGVTSFVSEQVESVSQLYGTKFEFSEIKKTGVLGYSSAYFSFIKKLLFGKYDLVHAHYGLSGIVACLQFFKPVVVTFHGCDVNDTKTRWISKIVYFLSSYSIFVEKEMPLKLKATGKKSVVPCGVNMDIFKPMDKQKARDILGYKEGEQLVLFSSAFDVPVKNYPLAKTACDLVPPVRLLELKNYSRDQVNWLLNACDLLLLTSIREGSPQIIKEAMACDCPIITTNVGDVENLLAGVSNSFICASDEGTISAKISEVLNRNARTNGRVKLIAEQLDLASIAKKINQIYLNVLQ